MRTIIIWQSSNGPVLIDKENSRRLENCKQIDIAPIQVNKPVEATLFLWPEEVLGTIQHKLEPTLERVLVEFAPLFPSVAKATCGLPDDFRMFLDDGNPVEYPRDFKMPREIDPLHPGDMGTSSGPGEIT